MIRAFLLSTLLTSPALAEECARSQVDAEISLVADVSTSMDVRERGVQRTGYAAAFRDPSVLHAIMDGYCGAIAVNLIEFGTEPHVVVDWHIIATDEDAETFARAIEAAKPTNDRIGTTGLAKAIEFAAKSILENNLSGERLVVDASSDGPDNVTSNVSDVRDKYTQPTAENNWTEIVINGLPILGGLTPHGMNAEEFQEYFFRNVIGGPGCFLEAARDADDIARAFRKKLIAEIG
ncbi:DUF1194 domain-containing protein [Roseibium album]|uniref:DUF1194 domain-containing protein n=1 Tax=Roseibium album TaxID=311410 RepID=UPI003BB106D1